MAKCLALVDVADVHLDEANLAGADGIAQGNAGMGQAARIDNAESDAAVGPLMDFIDQGAFMIALKGFNASVVRGGLSGERGENVVKGGAAIDFGFAHAQAVEVGSIQHGNGFHER